MYLLWCKVDLQEQQLFICGTKDRYSMQKSLHFLISIFAPKYKTRSQCSSGWSASFNDQHLSTKEDKELTNSPHSDAETSADGEGNQLL